MSLIISIKNTLKVKKDRGRPYTFDSCVLSFSTNKYNKLIHADLNYIYVPLIRTIKKTNSEK